MAFVILLAMLAVSIGAAKPRNATCPPGEGFAPDNEICSTCGAGTWSDDTSIECTRCRPGTWSAAVAAEDISVCSPCPVGTWSSQEGSPTMTSCQPCSAGRVGLREGLATHLECHPCPEGSWSNAEGATKMDVCTKCKKGTWNAVLGASTEKSCIMCSRGTWSDKVGAKNQTACHQCQAGTWSDVRGADDIEACQACPAGQFQPAFGQTSDEVCLPCPPGQYSPVPGAEICSECPAGTWNAGFNATVCTLCAPGSWTRTRGSLRLDACQSCVGYPNCLPDGSMHISMALVGLDQAGLNDKQRKKLAAIYAEAIASAANVDNSSVVDPYGNKAVVSISEDNMVESYVLGISQSSASDIASRVYSESFREEVVNATLDFLSHASVKQSNSIFVGDISAQPQRFTKIRQPKPIKRNTTARPANVTERNFDLPAEDEDADADKDKASVDVDTISGAAVLGPAILTTAAFLVMAAQVQ